VQKGLKRALRKGARASRLVLYTPDVVDLLVPEDSGRSDDESHASQEPSIHRRALIAERIIRAAIERIGGADAEALMILLSLRPGTLGLTLDSRRQAAARLVGVRAETFRRKNHEGLMIWDLAMEIWDLITEPLG